jgi:sporulation protein YlmC with PRC-barrel domain
MAMDFHFGARVISSDGAHIGSVRRVIVDRESLDVHAIVVKETQRFSGRWFAGSALMEDDIAIPIGYVRSADRDEVVLDVTASRARHVPPYLRYEAEPVDRDEPFRVALGVLGQAPTPVPLQATDERKPGELEIDPGEPVMLRGGGRQLGTVRDVVLDDGELVGVVIHRSGFFQGDVLLQVRFLVRAEDDRLVAWILEEDLERLRPFHPDDELPRASDN